MKRIVGATLLACAQLSSADTFTVDSLIDGLNSNDINPGNGVCLDGNGHCSLRAAIEEANALNGADVVSFAVSGVIAISDDQGELPPLNDSVTLDGYSAPGYNSASTTISDAPPTISIDGSNLSEPTAIGIKVGLAEVAVIRGLGVVRFPKIGIRSLGQDSEIVIQGCYIGVQADGTPAGNGGTGIVTTASDRAPIIGVNRDLSGLGNVIADNLGSGIAAQSDGVVIAGNIIGADPTGTIALPNGAPGIQIFGNDARVGLHVQGNGRRGGNQVIANTQSGILIDAGIRARVINNDIGALSGQVSPGYGIEVRASTALIGADSRDAGNRIDGFALDGIYVRGDFNHVFGNLVGTRRGNTASGINVASGSNNRLTNNVIANNLGNGISDSASGTIVVANHIGTQTVADRSQPGGNGVHGIYSSGANVVVGSSQGVANVLGFNGSSANDHAIMVAGSNATVSNNLVGISENGESIAGAGAGIMCAGVGCTVEDSAIGNHLAGVVVRAENASLRFNLIGIDSKGRTHANAESGVSLEIGSENASLGGNLIANNAGPGVQITGGANHSVVGDEFIGNSMPIDLAGDGRTTNDITDADTGPNDLQNHPEIISTRTETEIFYALDVQFLVDTSENDATYPLWIEVYFQRSPDALRTRLRGFQYDQPQTPVTERIFLGEDEFQGWISLVATSNVTEGSTSEFGPAAYFDVDGIIFVNGFD